MTRRSFAGSLIGGIRQTQEMLDFCARRHIGAEVEVIPADKINEAYERVLASDVRYRWELAPCAAICSFRCATNSFASGLSFSRT